MQKVFRQDIQQLRGIAVLAVIVNHLGVDWLPGGYLGVDVFFVVSGYVITHSMLTGNTQAISRLRFFAQFWIRRVFRLWPMLFATVLLTSALLIVTGLGRPDTFITGIASLVGLANLRLLVGRLEYFALDTGSDWFMHTWSLAVEEQVYLVLSLIFAVFGGGARLLGSSRRLGIITACIGTLTALSLAASLAPFTTELVRFYSPHTRLYQIGAGALLALLAARSTSRTASPSTRIKQAIVFIGLAGLFAQFVTDVAAGATASLVSTVLTTLVLASATPLQHSTGFLPVRWISAIGDRSYALYLVHWPVQLLATSVTDHEVGKTLLSLSLTFALGVLSYRLIENPTRHLWRGMRARRSIGLALGGLAIVSALTGAGYEYINQKNTSQLVAIPTETCDRQNSSIWLIGDSHLEAIEHEIAAALNSDCLIFGDFGFNVILDSDIIGLLPSGQGARSFKLRDIEELVVEIRSRQPQLIVVSHFLTGSMSAPETAPESANWVTVDWRNSKGSPISRELFMRQFKQNLIDLTLTMSQHDGLMFVTSPPPDFDWLSEPNDPYSNLSYETLCSKLLFPSTTHQRIIPQCEIWRSEAVLSRKTHELRIGEIHDLLNTIQKSSDNFVHIALDEPFCNNFECRNFKMGIPLYKDDDHLNAVGARMISQKLKKMFDKVRPSEPGALKCDTGQSVFLCRVVAGSYHFPPSFVDTSNSTILIMRIDHTDDFGNPYCVSLWASNEATFTPGRCD